MDRLIPILMSPGLPEMRTAEEDWTGKTNRRERRKLQNRLNQRALRRRREMIITSSSTGIANVRQPYLSSAIKDSSSKNLIQTAPDQYDTQEASERQLVRKFTCRLGLPGGCDMLTNAAQAAFERCRTGQPDPRQLLDVFRFNIFYAFGHNAKVLGFNDDWLKDDTISLFSATQVGPRRLPTALNCPPNMKPTFLQTTVEHHPWIDLLPCPRMRDNFLKLVRDRGEDAVDEDDLCADIVEVESARGAEVTCLITWGEPWALSDWEVTEPFMKKWAWLLEGCTELLESTNVWRRKRGLHDIHLSNSYNWDD